MSRFCVGLTTKAVDALAGQGASTPAYFRRTPRTSNAALRDAAAADCKAKHSQAPIGSHYSEGVVRGGVTTRRTAPFPSFFDGPVVVGSTRPAGSADVGVILLRLSERRSGLIERSAGPSGIGGGLAKSIR